MKTYISLFFLFFLVLGCSSGGPKKPNNLISISTMIQIQTDLSIMEVIEKTYQGEVVSDSILGLPYIYSKYKIDSLRWANSEAYYAGNPKQNVQIFTAVRKALDRKIDSINKAIQNPLNQE